MCSLSSLRSAARTPSALHEERASDRLSLVLSAAGRFRQLSLFRPTASSTSPSTTSTTNVALLDLARRPVLLVSHPGHRPSLDAPDPRPALDQLRGGQP